MWMLEKRLQRQWLLMFAAMLLAPGAGALASADTAGQAVAPFTAADAPFTEPFIDIDEWRDEPVRHRYVHGGFSNTDLKFSFYLPPKDQFEGRFFQYVTPIPDNENLAQNPEDYKIGFSIDSGAYFVETNGGGSNATAGPAYRSDPTIGAYRANAAAARYSRVVANEMYGPGRIYGYLYGGSGGGYRTLGSMENTSGVWDGAVPFVIGSPMAAPNSFTVRMHAMRILEDKFPQIVDAMDAGGSGDPYRGLNEEQAAALREATRMGFPLNSWFGYETMGVHAFTVLYQGMVMADPGYFEDFWSKPGYLGHNPPESLSKARLQFKTRIKAAISEQEAEARGLPVMRIPGTARGAAATAWQRVVDDGSQRPVAYQFADTPPDVGFLGGDLVVLTGEASGAHIALRTLDGDTATLGVVDLATLAKLKPGDEVRVDNSNFLAAQTYHRHQVPGPDYPVYDQFRDRDGKPIYPQRPMLLGPMFAAGAAGTVPTGTFNGKIISVNSLLDREATPWQADWYRRRFDANYGEDAVNRYRLWYTENALHGTTESETAPTRVINYAPLLQQALRDVAAWVEKGTPPPATTQYEVVDGQVEIPLKAAERRGIQPVITLAANGSSRAEVPAGTPVTFTGRIAVPPGTGYVVAAEWDFDGSGDFSQSAEVPSMQQSVEVTTTHAFDEPGTYFVALRGFSHRSGDKATPYARIPNLARARVVVK